MRWRVANFLSSTCPAKTAVSSSSSRAKSGTCFNTSGLHAIGHLVRQKWIAPIHLEHFINEQETTTDCGIRRARSVGHIFIRYFLSRCFGHVGPPPSLEQIKTEATR